MHFYRKQFFFFFLTAFFVFHTVVASPPASPAEMKDSLHPTAPHNSCGTCNKIVSDVATLSSLLVFLGGVSAIIIGPNYGDDCCKDAVAFCCPRSGTANCTQTFQQCPQCPADHNRDCKKA